MCPHYWLIDELAVEGQFKGSCRHCGETRTWPADPEFPGRAQPGSVGKAERWYRSLEEVPNAS